MNKKSADNTLIFHGKKKKKSSHFRKKENNKFVVNTFENRIDVEN